MAQFDEVFADLQAKIGAAIAVIMQDPAIAVQVRDAIANAQAQAEIQEQQAADDARANALRQMVTQVRDTLAQVPDPE